ncbi:MAG: RDD family protein [Isosphaeraceae bacterium]
MTNTGGYTGYAGFWIRWVAAFIDNIILQVVILPVSFLVGMVLGVLIVSTGGDPAQPGPQAILQIIGALLSMAIQIGYNVYMISSPKQATFGKMALGLKVTDLYGQRITVGRAFGREFGKILSGLTLLVGYMMAGWTEKKQALHDMIASTLVLKTR